MAQFSILDEMREIVTEDEFINLLYQHVSIKHGMADSAEWATEYSASCLEFGEIEPPTWDIADNQTPEEYIQSCVVDWNLPDKYAQFDILEFVLDQCTSEEQVERIMIEWTEFEKRNMGIVLRFLKFFVDTMTGANLIWGVGRGSSTASYLLYLLGVHRIDALKYDLPLSDFLR
jgi:DNA polymerase III alpha subunit